MDWDSYFLDLANVVRTKSKDPSTQVGAVIVRQTNEIVSTGFNGFPRGIEENYRERWERPLKYEYVVHAESNSVLNAARIGVSVEGCKLYLSGMYMPCTDCAKCLIQAGICEIIARQEDVPERWFTDMSFAQDLLFEAKVIFRGVSNGRN